MTIGQPIGGNRGSSVLTALRRPLAAAAILAGLVGGTHLTIAAFAGTVPPGADPRQNLVWQRCAEDKPVEYECTTIKVPLNYEQPGGTTIDVAVSRIKTSVPGKRRGVLLFNPGGPGAKGRSMPLEKRSEFPQEVLDQYDLVGFDPRGIGASSPITCDLSPEEQRELSQFKPETFATDVAWARAVADKCAARGETIAYITTRNTARDMDTLRGVLGEEKISYFGQSYGTYLGATYLQLFPERADRFVLDSAMDPALAWRGSFQAFAVGSRPAFDRWTQWTAQRHAQYRLGDTPAKVSAAFWDLVARADRTPIMYDGAPWTGDDIRLDAQEGVFNLKEQATKIVDLTKAPTAGTPAETPPAAGTPAETSPADAPVSRPTPAGPSGAAVPTTSPTPAVPVAAAAVPVDNHLAVLWAIACNDVTNWPRDPEQYRRDAIRDRVEYPLGGDSMSNIFPCAFWTVPHTERSATIDNASPALVVQNEWDAQTPSFSGIGLHRALKGSRLIFVDEGEGHGVYKKSGNACAYNAVNDYLNSGALPAADITCTVDAAP
jgi:pimeloyl-ACP methyl ester carboxylesterase